MSSILVAYASKHGATQGIAERIADYLRAAGQDAEVLPVERVYDVTPYDAFIIGSAVYMGSWLKEATEFVRRNEAFLSTRPVWLFSSGPLGNAAQDSQGRDLLQISEPKQFAELKQTIRPRGLRVFFGALDPSKLGFAERLMRSLPAGRAVLPEGDFRDWTAIEEWTGSIAHELAPVPAALG